MSQLTEKQLSTIIRINDNSQFLINTAYYEVKNTALLNKDSESTPDNRIPLPLARKTVNDIVGYSYKPGKVRYIFDNEENDKASVEYVEDVLERNQEPIVSAEIYTNALIQSKGAEVIWINEDGEIEFEKVPREECIFVYKDTIKPELDYSIRYYNIDWIDEAGLKRTTRKAVVYSADKIEYYEYIEKGEKGKIDPQTQQTYSTLTKDDVLYKFVEDEMHFFESPPLYPYEISNDNLGVFQPSIPIIDILDNFGSDSIANSLDRFHADFMAFTQQLTPEMAKNIKDNKVFDNLGAGFEHDVKFINRQMDINSSVEGFKLFYKLYYELTNSINFNDEKFNSQSGIAILYALIPFENQVSKYEVYFSKGLQHRLDLINIINVKLNRAQPVTAVLKWERNLPFDLETRVRILKDLKELNLLSDHTLISKFIPENLIEAADIEMEKKAEEDSSKIDLSFQSERDIIEEPQEEEDIEEDVE